MNITLTPLIPELLLTGGILILLIIDLIQRERRGIVTAAGGSILLILVAVVAVTFGDARGDYLFGSATADGVTQFFRLFFALATVLSMGMMTFSFHDEGEPYLLMLAGTLGMMLLAAANDVITLFVALELVSIPSYVLAGYRRSDPKSGEAALKYVLFGAVSSGVMVYGFSLLYGLTGTTNLPELAVRSAALDGGAATALFAGLAMILAGIGYKIAMVPFHFWCPDVYEGSPTAVTAFFSVAPKAAGLAALFRLMPVYSTLDPVYGISAVGLFTLASAVTMSFGNLGALWQSSLKRLLAYSSIAHAGYILMGFAVMAAYPDSELYRDASAAVLFYLAVYLFMNFGAFVVIDLVERETGGEKLSFFRGLGKLAPAPALALAVFLLSLVGLPPLAGFIGKFFLFAALVKGKLFGLAFIGIANTVVSLYYYVRVIRDMFLYDPAPDVALAAANPGFRMGALAGALIMATVVPTVALGIFWGALAGWIRMLLLLRGALYSSNGL